MQTNDIVPSAIPTVYSGTQFKSRFEAQAAYLFDRLGWRWEYEPHSFFLPNGVSYTPDFLIPDHNMFVECRGYDSENGKLQIEGFTKMIGEGRGIPFGSDGEFADRFVVLFGDTEACLVSGNDHTGMALLVHCKDCGWTTGGVSSSVGVMGFPQVYCASCIAPNLLPGWRAWDGKTRIDKLAVITVSKGKILVNGAGSAEWAASNFFSPTIGHEPFNLSAEEMESEWGASE